MFPQTFLKSIKFYYFDIIENLSLKKEVSFSWDQMDSGHPPKE